MTWLVEQFRSRWMLLLLLAVFHGAYGMRLLIQHPGGAEIPNFEGSPQFTPVNESSIEYATNTPSTILRVGGFYYLWRDGAWFRSSSARGKYQKTGALPAELKQSPVE